MPISLNGTTGITFPDNSLQAAAASPYVLKNRIINGGMQIWQRGTSFTISGSAFAYTVDRWNNNFQNGTYSQSSSVPSGAGFQYSLSIASNSANYGSIQQRIESFNTQDLVGQVITVSFWALASVGGASGLNIGLTFPTAVDNYTSTTSISTATTSALTGSWVKYTTSFNGAVMPSGVANGLQLTIFNPAGGTSAITYLITGVQLEIGSTATPFERRLYNQELANCQRYFLKLGGDNAYTPYGTGNNYSTTNGNMMVNYPVSMRTSPTLTATAPNRVLSGSANSSVTSLALGNGGALGSYIDYTSTGLTLGHGSLLTANGSTVANLSFSAEL